MATKFIPAIAPSEYPAFRHILKDLPGTYEEWLYSARKAALEHDATGGTSERVEVLSSEFVRYCKSIKADRNVHSLWLFAHEKGMGREF